MRGRDTAIRYMTFEQILPFMRAGYFVRRANWSPIYCICMVLKAQKGYKEDMVPAMLNILLIEAADEERGSDIHLTVGWRPHTADFLASDWHCVNLYMRPITDLLHGDPDPILIAPHINKINF